MPSQGHRLTSGKVETTSSMFQIQDQCFQNTQANCVFNMIQFNFISTCYLPHQVSSYHLILIPLKHRSIDSLKGSNEMIQNVSVISSKVIYFYILRSKLHSDIVF